jgi:hypothetical protein
MSPIALILNLTLGVLLIGAMILGQRLDRRLKALRASHNSFAKAVSELDQAALRTQSGLNELKATAEDARTALAERIDAARVLSDRLGKLIGEADAKVEVLSQAQARVSARTPRPILLRSIAELEAAPAQPAPAAPLARTIPAARSRANVDDELFEAVRPSLSALAGGRP